MTFDDLIAKYDHANDKHKAALGDYDSNDPAERRENSLRDIGAAQRQLDDAEKPLVRCLDDRAVVHGGRVFVVLSDRDGDRFLGVFTAVPSSTEIPDAQ